MPISLLKKHLALVLLLFCSNSLLALPYTNLSVKDGLSSRKVFTLSKDNKGYMWIATGRSIDRYNGDKFITYHLQRENGDRQKPKGIANDLQGDIYAYTEKSIFKYNSHSDCFEVLAEVELLNRETITCLYFCANDVMWIGTTDGLLTRSKKQTCQRMKTLRKKRVYAMTSDAKENLWVGTNEGLIKLTTNTTLAPNEAPIAFQTLDNIRIESLFYDQTTKLLWIGSFTDGLKVLNTENQTLSYEKPFASSFPIRTISPIDSTTVWVGIDGMGLYEFDRAKPKHTKTYSQTASEEGNRITSNSIYDIKSEESLIWVCTYNSGLMVINKETIQSQLFQHKPSSSQSIGNNHVNTILEDNEGNLWFGTNHGISVLNPNTNKWTQLLQNKNEKSVILALSQDDFGNIWAGGYATELRIISPQTGQITRLDEVAADNRYVYSIINDQQGNMWFGGVINELTKYEQNTKETIRYEVKGINKIINYNDTSLLLATTKGALLFNKASGTCKRIDLKTDQQNANEQPFVHNIQPDPRNPKLLWIGTENEGIVSYNWRTQVSKSYNKLRGLSSNAAYGILFDAENNMWVSTELGLNCLSANRDNISVYSPNDGLSSTSFNFLAYAKLKNGLMLWGTADGAIETTPLLASSARNQAANLVIEDLSIFNERITSNSPNSPLTTAIDDATQIELNHKQHSFSFNFIHINYKNSKTLYSWYLEGFDTDWSKPSDSHRATYTNIPPGEYIFKLKALPMENSEQEVLRQILVKIHAPIWASPYAYALYLLLALGLMYFLHRVYLNKLKATESDKKIKFFIHMAHDIRTPLTLIKAPLNEIGEEQLSDSAHAALGLAKRNTDKLLHMMSQLLDFQKIEREAMALHVEQTNIKSFIENTAANFLMLASEKQIDFSLQMPKQETQGWMDQKKVTIILDNLLSNAIKYTPKRGKVLLKLSLTNQQAFIEIIDDGIGISTTEQNNLFKRFYRAENAANFTETGSGIGLLLTKRMVELHKGKISFTSVEKMGTSFKIEIPIAKQNYSENELIPTKTRADIQSDEPIKNTSDKTKILLVEDNTDLRTYLTKYLQKKYTVLEAEDGQKALDMVPTFNPDFIISDILMPHLSGLELSQQLKTNIKTCHIPIILLTSLAERDDVLKGLEVGADDYITKPFDMPILESKIQAIMRNRARYKKKYIDRSAFEDNSKEVSTLDKEFMSQVLDKIEENIANENFTIDTLALEMAMSRTVFYHKIRSLTAQSPIHLIIDLRMKKAAALLRGNRYTIAEVAYLTGSSNPKYFSTAFKRYYGLTPSQFIAQNDGAERC